MSVALDPRRSMVVEACAGSGKTWLLVSRMVRLLLDGVRPSQIIAITFTRKAAQEMRARLQLWLRELAVADDAALAQFFAERGLPDLTETQRLRARQLYGEVLLAQPGITISTFHGWFMQLMQRAPLNAEVMHGATLLERAGSLQDEAWEELLVQLQQQPESVLAQQMQWLFAEQGLHNTRKLLFNFLAKRSEWWAYVQGQQDALQFALDNLRNDLQVEMDFDAVSDWGMCGNSEEIFFAFVRQLAANGTEVQQGKASELERAWSESEAEQRYLKMFPLLYTQAGEPRSFKPTKKQNAEAFLLTRDALFDSLQDVRDTVAEQQAYRLNEAVLHCGVALLERYQLLKQQKQQLDFTDLEWQLCHLLQQSEHAETMQYKLDSRYRHVLLDEFQDTNPLQWQILCAWFDAAVAVESQPGVFVVGDPKQSIYRFRRADARLFGVARDYLKQNFAAHELHNNHTRRNSVAVLSVVNQVFAEHPQGFTDFEPHTAEHQQLPGYVAVLPLAVADEVADAPEWDGKLRNPLTMPRAEAGENSRHLEAAQFAEALQIMRRDWWVQEDGKTRRASYGDIMVLVRSRTHLALYEQALRANHIPFISSRRGGLLDTLEAEDVQALLMFLITPFADLALAQVLRCPIFSCCDEDLIQLSGFRIQESEEAAGFPESRILNPQSSSWWSCLQHASALGNATPTLQRAAELLTNWLALADKLPVHDLLDRIYFEGDVLARYSAVLAPDKRAKVAANLHAFMEIALSVDAGRYPSLPRFLQELRELRDSSDDAPDEGKLGKVGDALRIFTVHESKGLEAPIVWLLDANADKNNRDGHDVLADWPIKQGQLEDKPLHFSLYADLASRGKKRAPLFEQEALAQAREEMNLLYVAMTRARQALVVSGNVRTKARSSDSISWYERIAAASGNEQTAKSLTECLSNEANPLCSSQADDRGAHEHLNLSLVVDAVVLPEVIACGKRESPNSVAQQRGIWLHALLQHLTEAGSTEENIISQRLGIPREEITALRQQAQQLLMQPHLVQFFDAAKYVAACNEMPCIDAQGELQRIDRLVEFADEAWVLDYKLGERQEVARYRSKMLHYRAVVQQVFGSKAVRCALLFADGSLVEVS